MTLVEKFSQNLVFRLAPGIGTLNELILGPRYERRAGSKVREYISAPRTAKKAPIPIEGMCVSVK